MRKSSVSDSSDVKTEMTPRSSQAQDDVGMEESTQRIVRVGLSYDGDEQNEFSNNSIRTFRCSSIAVVLGAEQLLAGTPGFGSCP